MAQYFNVVTNASGTFTFEEVPRLCPVSGQRVQLVVEDINNSSNGSQQLVTYTTAPQNRQAIFSPQTINLGNQIAATRLEQGQNVFIIKTNDITTTQAILKSNTVNAHVINENIVSIPNNTGTKTECNNEGQVQWIMQNAATTTKQTLLQEKNLTTVITKNNVQNNTTSPPFHINSESLNSGQTGKKLIKTYQNKNQLLSTNNIQASTISKTPDGVNARNTVENRIKNSTMVGNSKSTMSVCNKTVNSLGQTVTVRPIRASNPNTLHQRPVAVVPPEISKTPTRVQPPDMEHLNEQIKQAKLKQLQLQKQQPRSQQNNAQRQHSNTAQHPVQCPSNNSARRLTNSVQQKAQQSSILSQKQPKSTVTSPPSSAEHNAHVSSTSMEVDSLECMQEKVLIMSQPSSPQSGHENSSIESIASNESFAYLQKTINDPSTAIVQHQIKGNEAKMLVMLTAGEQRLITFEIPNEDCTVHDLLDQVRAVLGQINVTFSSKTTVSLVDDPTLGINYIVEEVGSNSLDDSDHNDSNSIHEVVSSTTTTESLSQNTIASDENSNASLSAEMFYKKNNEQNTKTEKMEQDGPTSKRPKKKGRAEPKPIHKEPECLTISSDEEEEGRTKKVESVNNNAPLSNASNSFIEDMDTIIEKEPVITNTSIFNSYADYVANVEAGICDNQSFVDNEQLPQIAIECRTVRIGSYKYIPRENVVISHSSIRFSVPLLEDVTSFVTLEVKYKDIVKVLIHFGKTMPVLFFYTSPNVATMIRELLGMQDPKGPYYDPAGKDHTHRRITLLPDRLPEDSKFKLTNLFSTGNKIDDLNPKEANDILLRASPRDNQQSHNIITRKQSQSSVPNNTVGVSDSIQTITVYPPPPAKGGIAINTEDYLCLGEDQFLNDVIIDFYLKYLTLEILSVSDHQRTHVFSSYFYKRLTSPHAQATESIVPMTPAAKRHARVQKWTKNVNIFEKDFIIIPINEHAHWFLAIICFPGLVGKVATCAMNTKENDVHKIVKKSKKLKELKTKAVKIGSTTITPVPTTITIDQPDDGSERDEAEGDDEEMEMDSDEEDEMEQVEENKIQTNIKLEQQNEIVKIPCILIFDSLAGASRSRVVATLRDYLSCEYVAKLGAEKTFSKDTIKGACPKVPQQSNFTDCGLYVLQYVESFFKDPIKNYILPIKTLKSWFEEIIVTRKREELSKLLIKLMNKTKGDKTISLPTVNFPTQDGKLKPKTETQTDVKAAKTSEVVENKKKSTTNLDTETRTASFSAENTESSNEFSSNRTYPVSSNSTENNTTEMNLTEQKTARSSSETIYKISDFLSYLKAKRIPRLVTRQNQDDSPAKKHKGESSNSCK